MASRRSSGLVGRCQKNGRETHAVHLCQILVRLFDNHVRQQHAIRAGGGGIIRKFPQSIAQNQD